MIPRRRASSATGAGARGLGYHTMFGTEPSTLASKTCPASCPGPPVEQRAVARVPGRGGRRAERRDDRRWIHAQLQHFDAARRRPDRHGVQLGRPAVREFHFPEWLTTPEVREDLLQRMTEVLYRLLKGQNSVFNSAVFLDEEPQENIRT